MIEKKIELKRDNITLNGLLFIPKNGEKHPALIILHGLPSTPLPVEKKGYDDLGRKICELGIVSIIFNFSGCQGSGGYFSMKSWIQDLKIISNYIRNLDEVNPSKVSFLAFSMGTIPMIYFIAQQERNNEKIPKFLIICACPADLSEKRLVELRVGILLTNREGGIRIEEGYDKKIISEFREYMPIKWIKYISAPKFIIHGAHDDLINVRNAYKLYEKARDPRELLILKKAEHKLRQDTNAMKKILEIIDKFL